MHSYAVPHALLAAVDADEQQDQDADENLLDRFAGAMADEQGGEEGHDQRAERGAPVVAARADERGSADEDGGESEEQVGIADAGLALAGEADQHDPNQGRGDRADRERP